MRRGCTHNEPSGSILAEAAFSDGPEPAAEPWVLWSSVPLRPRPRPLKVVTRGEVRDPDDDTPCKFDGIRAKICSLARATSTRDDEGVEETNILYGNEKRWKREHRTRRRGSEGRYGGLQNNDSRGPAKRRFGGPIGKYQTLEKHEFHTYPAASCSANLAMRQMQRAWASRPGWQHVRHS